MFIGVENPPSPLFKGEQDNSPLKRGLGGFSEPTFEMGKLFNHESSAKSLADIPYLSILY